MKNISPDAWCILITSIFCVSAVICLVKIDENAESQMKAHIANCISNQDARSCVECADENELCKTILQDIAKEASDARH